MGWESAAELLCCPLFASDSTFRRLLLSEQLWWLVFTAVAGSYQHWKMGHVDWKSVKYIAPAGIVGVIIGSVLFYWIKDYHELIDLILELFCSHCRQYDLRGLFLRKRTFRPNNEVLLLKPESVEG